MTLTETCLLVIAISTGLVAVAVVVTLARLLKIWNHTNLLLNDLREVMARFNTVAAELEEAAHSTRAVGRRAMDTANRLLDEVDRPVRQLTAILAGVRAGLGSLFHVSQNGSRAHSESATRDDIPFERPSPSERRQP